MHFSFKGKKVLVTGAGRGIGRDIAKTLAEEGAVVYALSQNPDNLKSLQEEHPAIKVIACDLGNWSETEKALGNLEPLDYLVNNAGLNRKEKFSEITEETCDVLYNVNVKSLINVTKLVSNGMIKASKKGAIVNVSSVGGIKPGRDMMVYHSTKAAVEMLTKSMAKQLAPHGIRVNSINPTVIKTDMTSGVLSDAAADEIGKAMPLGQLPTVRHCTNVTLFLLSDLSEMTTGTFIPVDAGDLLR